MVCHDKSSTGNAGAGPLELVTDFAGAGPLVTVSRFGVVVGAADGGWGVMQVQVHLNL
jgi:hypothetical protein